MNDPQRALFMEAQEQPFMPQPGDAVPELQDLRMQRMGTPDPRYTVPSFIPAPKGRLDAPSMVVPSITNTHPVQTHIIIDRYNVPHKIRAGQTIHDVEMLVSEVDNFRKLRAPGRFTPTGLPLPQHPLVFDVPQIQQPLDGGEGERRAEARALKGKA